MNNCGYFAPRIVPGLDFTPAEVASARANHEILSLDLEITEACNGKCRYCYRYASEGAQPPAPDELTSSEVANLIQATHTHHGLRRLCILGGEPLLPSNREKYLTALNVCNCLDIKHVTFTNATCLTSDLARTLHDKKASLCLKLNGMTPEVHDGLVGIRGSFQKSMNAFETLLALGYGRPDSDQQLAFETVVVQQNYDQIEAMWRWSRDRGILPYVEKLTLQGRGRAHGDLQVSNEQLQSLFERLNEIDRTEYGLDWDVTPPIAGGYHCVRFYISMYVRANGIVCPCVGVDMHLGTLRTQSVTEILHSPITQITRNINRHIEGKCGACDLSDKCYGCRGAAYQAGNLFGEDPVCWRKQTPAIWHHETTEEETHDHELVAAAG